MMRESVDTLHSIAAYCLANQGRDIPKSEIVAACGFLTLGYFEKCSNVNLAMTRSSSVNK